MSTTCKLIKLIKPEKVVIDYSDRYCESFYHSELTFPEVAELYPDLCLEATVKVINWKKTLEKIPRLQEFFGVKDIEFFNEEDYQDDIGFDYTEKAETELTEYVYKESMDDTNDDFVGCTWLLEDFHNNKETILSYGLPLEVTINKNDIIVEEIVVKFFNTEYLGFEESVGYIFIKNPKVITTKEQLYQEIIENVEENMVDDMFEIYDKWQDDWTILCEH